MGAEARPDIRVSCRQPVRCEQHSNGCTSPGSGCAQAGNHRVESGLGAGFERIDERSPIAGALVCQFGEPSSKLCRYCCQQFGFDHAAL